MTATAPLEGTYQMSGVLTSGEPPKKFPVRPARYQLLVRLPERAKKTESGLYMPDERAEIENRWSLEVQIVAMGPTAFQDKERFPYGPEAKVGDWVLITGMGGSNGFKMKGYGDTEYRLINDDSPLAYLDGPGFVERM